MQYPAIITDIIFNKIIVTYYRLPEPDIADPQYWFQEGDPLTMPTYREDFNEYKDSEVTAEVENAELVDDEDPDHIIAIDIINDENIWLCKIGRSCIIDETVEGKCKIIKLDENEEII
jgi:hypothetical protein